MVFFFWLEVFMHPSLNLYPQYYWRISCSKSKVSSSLPSKPRQLDHSWKLTKVLALQNKGYPLSSFTPWATASIVPLITILSTDEDKMRQHRMGLIFSPWWEKWVNLWKPTPGVGWGMMYSLRPLNLDVYIPTKRSIIKDRLNSVLDFYFPAPLSSTP